MEQQRFLNFGTEAGLLLEDGKLTSTLKVNHTVLLAVLAENKGLFERFEKKHGRYDKIAPTATVDWNDLSEPETALEALVFDPSRSSPQAVSDQEPQTWITRILNKLRQKMVHSGTRLRQVITEPRRLVWVSFDKGEYEEMLNRIGELNSFLIALLEGSQIDRIRQDTAASYHEILQLRNDVSSLHGLIEALQTHAAPIPLVDPSYSGLSETISFEASIDTKRRHFLSKLAQIKIEYSQVDNMAVNLRDFAHSSQIEEIKAIVKKEFPGSLEDITGVRWESWRRYRQAASRSEGGQKQRVWVEWKETQNTVSLSMPVLRIIENRICLLTDLLSHKMPSDFRAILGYVRSDDDDDNNPSFGLILGSPTQAQSGTDVELCTLNDLLRSGTKVSLSRRMALCSALAESLYNFHSVNWLHKGIRSDSVIFFSEKGKGPDIGAPYLSGFDLSRPDIATGMTERPALNPARDMYRHPDTQSIRSSGGYTKAFGMYSLGVVFLEVAFWKPIEEVLGFEDPTKLDNSTLFRIRERLLEGEKGADPSNPAIAKLNILNGIASECGDGYEEVVELCLRADEIEQPLTAHEPPQRTAARLHRIMEMSVVAKLRQMTAAMAVH